MCCFEQILKVTSNKTAVVQPLTSHLLNYPSKMNKMCRGHCWRSKDKLISDVLLLTLTHGHTGFSWPVRTYIHKLCVDTGYSLEDLRGVMDDEMMMLGKCLHRIFPIFSCWWLSTIISHYQVWYLKCYSFFSSEKHSCTKFLSVCLSLYIYREVNNGK